MPVLPACDGVKELDPAMHLIKRYKQLSAVERSLFFRALAAVAVLFARKAKATGGAAGAH